MATPRSGAVPRALVIGGSVGGLSAAILLRRHGWDVEVYERAEQDLETRGAGIATQDVLYDALSSAGVEVRDEMGVPSHGRVMFGRDGEVLGANDTAQIMTSWGFIYRFLREQVPDRCYHRGHVLESVEQTGDGVRARFANGREATGDWLVAADGPRSTVRACLAPEVTLNYCGYYLWRGLIDEARVPADVLDQAAQRMMFGMAPGGHWLGYLVAGPGDTLEPGQRWYNWGWYRSGDEAVLADLMTDAEGRHYPQGIPHDRIRAGHVAAMRAEARAYLSPQSQAVVEATPQPFLQGIYDAGSTQLVFGRCALIGDAAFTARPHVGMGVGKAIDDAASLAAALAAPEQATAVATWERERLAFGQAVLDWSRDLGSYIGPPPADDEARAKAAHYRQPEVLLAVSAASSPSQYLDARAR